MADVIEPLNRDYPRVIGRGDTGTGDVSFLPPLHGSPLHVSRPSRLLSAAPLLFSYSFFFFNFFRNFSIERVCFSLLIILRFCFDGAFV